FATRASGELERRRQLHDLEHLAHHDTLTGLPNRMLLRKRMNASLARMRESGTAGALMMIDLDRFKEINDTLGHHVGDDLLVHVADRLRKEIGGEGVDLARLGGDEFAIWIEDVGSTGEAGAVAERAIEALTSPFELEGYRLEVGASLGVALAPLNGSTVSALKRCADVAMYTAKRRGKNYCFYDNMEDPYTAERLVLMSQLGQAVRNGEIE